MLNLVVYIVTTGLYRIGLHKKIRSVVFTNRSGQRAVYLFSIQQDANFMKDRNQRLQWILTPFGVKWAGSGLHPHLEQYLQNIL